MKQIQLYIAGSFLVAALLFFLLWRKTKYAFESYKQQTEIQLLKSQLETSELIGEINTIRERRELRDSLLLINKKQRENEKIKLLENANDSTIDAIIHDFIRGSNAQRR
jgi:hypothetical protein